MCPAAYSQSPGGQAYIQALDASGHGISGTYVTYPSSGWAAGQHNQSEPPYVGAWETLPIPARSQADIHSVEFSLSNSDCWAVFDNLTYQR